MFVYDGGEASVIATCHVGEREGGGDLGLVLRVGDGQAEFDCAPGRERALQEQIGSGVFQAAFDALKQRFRR